MLPQWMVKIEKRLSPRNMVRFACVYHNKNVCTKGRWVMHNDHYWVRIHFNMLCLFIWLNKEINLSCMDFTSVLVVTEVIFEFYWEKFLCKGHILRARAGPGGPKKSTGRAELKLNRAGRAWRKAGPLWAGPGHKKVARFEPCYELASM